jgi:hypothetical protein
MKKALIIFLSLFVLAAVTLGVHILLVTRSHTKRLVMARIDLHQPIGRADADSITAWLYRQKGVNHVLVNSQAAIAVFTFTPATNNANGIVRAFKASLPYSKAERFLPTGIMMKSGCPVLH